MSVRRFPVAEIVAVAWLSGLFCSVVHGAVFVTGADLVSSRSTDPTDAALVAADGWADSSNGFKISWDISFNAGTSLWEYEYTLTAKDGTDTSPDLSHWLLEVSEAITTDNVENAIPGDNFNLVGPQLWMADPDSPNSTTPGANNANPNLPADLYGIKLDTEAPDVGGIYTFTSTQAPIWGDFYGKDGVVNAGGGDKIVATVWNTGIGTDPTDETIDFTPWVPTPDTESVIPEPSSICVWALLGGVGIAITRRRRT